MDNLFKSSFSSNESQELEPPELQKAITAITAAIHFLNKHQDPEVPAWLLPRCFSTPKPMHIVRSRMGETDAFP